MSVLAVRNTLVRGLELTLIGGFSGLTLDVLWGVFSRYALAAQSRWTEELAIYLLMWISLLGAALAYAERGHLGVDYFVSKMDPEAQRFARAFAECMVAAFSAFVLLYGGSQLVLRTLESGQSSAALGLPMGWVYLSVPVSGAFQGAPKSSRSATAPALPSPERRLHPLRGTENLLDFLLSSKPM